jgi:hypothetical protein
VRYLNAAHKVNVYWRDHLVLSVRNRFRFVGCSCSGLNHFDPPTLLYVKLKPNFMKILKGYMHLSPRWYSDLIVKGFCQQLKPQRLCRWCRSYWQSLSPLLNRRGRRCQTKRNILVHRVGDCAGVLEACSPEQLEYTSQIKVRGKVVPVLN